MPEPSIRKVTDVESLKAVAHPIRVRLLGSLRIDGPATASELGRRLGESSGSTSYHLRQLERFGFIEEDPEQPNARDRRWRARHRYTSWRNSDFVDDPASREAARMMRMRQAQYLEETVERFDEQLESWSRDWIDAAGMSDDVIRLRPATLKRLGDRVMELAHEYAAHDAGAEGTELVTLFLGGFPRREAR